MINPFIKLTGGGKDDVLHVQIANINGIVPVNGFTEVSLNDCAYIVKETTEEIAAMIQKYYDEKMRMDFIQSVLTGICANITVNDMTTDHRSLCIDAVQIGNAMMEVLKND